MKKILVILALIIPFFSSSSFAQAAIECELPENKESTLKEITLLKGVVSDVENYKPLDNVVVTIKNMETDVVKSVETDKKGNFSFSEIAGGAYEISFQRKGYKPYSYETVWVTEGKKCTLGFPLYKM